MSYLLLLLLGVCERFGSPDAADAVPLSLDRKQGFSIDNLLPELKYLGHYANKKNGICGLFVFVRGSSTMTTELLRSAYIF